jgi:hypothetical protein
VLREAGQFLGAHVGAGRDHQVVLGEFPAFGRDPLRVGVHLAPPVLDEGDLLTAGGAFETDLHEQPEGG